jgi:patatin-like phospholipase/acyl hydrolase
MQEIQRLKEDDEVPLPCQYFDLMGGTSTGGLIAIMLGRLRMVHFKIICFKLTNEI